MQGKRMNVNEVGTSDRVQLNASNPRARLAQRMSNMKPRNKPRNNIDPLKPSHWHNMHIPTQPLPITNATRSRSRGRPTISSSDQVPKAFVRNDAASMVRDKLTRNLNSKDAQIRLKPATAFKHSSKVDPTISRSRSSSSRAKKGRTVPVISKILRADDEEEEEPSQRQIELRHFIERERLIRKNEREMKKLHHQNENENEVLRDESNDNICSENNKTEMSGYEIGPASSAVGSEISDQRCHQSKSKVKGVSTNVLGNVCTNTKVEVDLSRYEGPPEMDEDEPIYSVIRKKMMSPPVHKPNKPNEDENNRVKDNSFVRETTSVVKESTTYNSFFPVEGSNKLLRTERSKSPKPSSGHFFFVPIEEHKPSVVRKTVPVITLGTFAESAWLEFGEDKLNIVGRPRSLPFDLFVPETSYLDIFRVQVEKVPVKKGFTLGLVCENEHVKADGDEDKDRQSSTLFYVKRGEKKRLFLTWTPTAPGGVCEVVYLKLPRGRVRVTARGNAMLKERKATMNRRRRKKTLRGSSMPSNGGFSKQLPEDVIVPAVRSIVRKTTQIAVSGRPDDPKTSQPSVPAFDLSIAQRSWSTYSNGCDSKQCEAYAKWLNHMFQNPDFINESDQSHHSDTVTLRALQTRRRRTQTNERAQLYFNSPEMQRILFSIQDEVYSKRLCIRSDHDVFANVNLRHQMISLLMSYSTPWLKIGLETIFNAVISVNVDETSLRGQAKVRASLGIMEQPEKKVTMRTAIKRFVLDRVLADPDLKKKYTGGKCNVPSGRFERKYKKELNAHILSNVLSLVIFLDGAKRNNIISSPVRLFNRNGMIKSSQSFLNALCRDYIRGIGNLSKHLSQKGIFVSFEQSPLEELEFSVSNLATDLRDGVRLGRLAELLSGTSGILEQMRLPAISRLQKVHNVGISLSALAVLGIPNVDKIHPNYIVDGHRPQVLKMLWSIITSFQLCTLLDPRRLKEEIYSIHGTIEGRDEPISFSPICGDIRTCEDICDLLLAWSHAICSLFDCETINFSSSFADGRAMCLLIHYYHPQVIRLCDIFPTTSTTWNKNNELEDTYHIQKMVENERRNCFLATEKMVEIGGIPNMFPISDRFNAPDERATIICVAYLCARLLESSKEIAAALYIQAAFRRYQNQMRGHHSKIATKKIEAFWATHRQKYFNAQRTKYLKPVRVIEDFFISKRFVFRDLKRERTASIQIQRVVRGHIIRAFTKELIRQRRIAAFRIQRAFTGYRSRLRCSKKAYNVIKIQDFWRRSLKRRKDFEKIQSIVTVQSIVRRWLAIRQLPYMWTRMDHEQRLQLAAFSHQSLFRRNLTVKNRHFLLAKDPIDIAAKAIQEVFRRYTCRRLFDKKKFAVVRVQAAIRMNLSRQCYRLLRKSAIFIQAKWRCIRVHVRYNRYKSCVIRVQGFIRRFLLRTSLRSLDANAYTQNGIRHAKNSDFALSNLHSQHSRMKIKRKFTKLGASEERDLTRAAILIQSHWRRFVANLQYCFDLSDIVFIQSLVRKRLDFKRYQKKRSAVILIQKFFRAQYVVIQNNVNASGKHGIIDGIVTFQNIRMLKKTTSTRTSSHFTKDMTAPDFFSAATTIQTCWKRYAANANFLTLTKAVVAIQKFVRLSMHKKAGKDFCQLTHLSPNGNAVSMMRCHSHRPKTWSARKTGKLKIREYREKRIPSSEVCHIAATEIQRIWRGYSVNLDYMLMVAAATRIQILFRGYRNEKIKKRTKRGDKTEILKLTKKKYSGLAVKEGMHDTAETSQVGITRKVTEAGFDDENDSILIDTLNEMPVLSSTSLCNEIEQILDNIVSSKAPNSHREIATKHNSTTIHQPRGNKTNRTTHAHQIVTNHVRVKENLTKGSNFTINPQMVCKEDIAIPTTIRPCVASPRMELIAPLKASGSFYFTKIEEGPLTEVSRGTEVQVLNNRDKISLAAITSKIQHHLPSQMSPNSLDTLGLNGQVVSTQSNVVTTKNKTGTKSNSSKFLHTFQGNERGIISGREANYSQHMRDCSIQTMPGQSKIRANLISSTIPSSTAFTNTFSEHSGGITIMPNSKKIEAFQESKCIGPSTGACHTPKKILSGRGLLPAASGREETTWKVQGIGSTCPISRDHQTNRQKPNVESEKSSTYVNTKHTSESQRAQSNYNQVAVEPISLTQERGYHLRTSGSGEFLIPSRTQENAEIGVAGNAMKQDNENILTNHFGEAKTTLKVQGIGSTCPISRDHQTNRQKPNVESEKSSTYVNTKHTSESQGVKSNYNIEAADFQARSFKNRVRKGCHLRTSGSGKFLIPSLTQQSMITVIDDSMEQVEGQLTHIYDINGPTEDALNALKKCTNLRDVMRAIKTVEVSTKNSHTCCKQFAKSSTSTMLYELMRSCNRSLPHMELLQYILNILSNVSKHTALLPSMTDEKCVDTLIDLIQLFRDKDEIFCAAAIILKRIVFSDETFLLKCKKKENIKRILGVYKLRKSEHSVRLKQHKSLSGTRILGRILEKCIAK